MKLLDVGGVRCVGMAFVAVMMSQRAAHLPDIGVVHCAEEVQERDFVVT